jgi:hypothetical protein
MKNISSLRSLALAATWMGTFAGLHAVELKPKADNPKFAVIQALSIQLDAQLAHLDKYETLRQEYEDPTANPPQRHVFLMRLEHGIEAVTESHTSEGVFTQKDYYMHESKVYAHRISHHEPTLDGKTKRVAESYILFDAEGNPIFRSQVVTRIPLGVKAPDLTKLKDQEVPLPAGLDGWGKKLTGHAFSIARTFRPGMGRYTFGDWDAWLLKGAPPEEEEELEPEDRAEDWLPAEDTLMLPVRGSSSPDGLFQIGWGYEKGPVDWESLAYIEGKESGKPYPTFSTKMPVAVPEALQNDGNFLMNAVSGKSLATLKSDYPGERQRFNHDELNAHWSPSSLCFVVRVEQKWSTEYAEIGWIKNGVCEGTYGILDPLEKAAVDAVKSSKHPASALMKKAGDDEEGYSFALSKVLLEDNGQFEMHVVGQIPKDDRPGGLYEVIIEGTFSQGEKDGSAVLKVSKARVLPPIENN